jgi:hypothetical protein
MRLHLRLAACPIMALLSLGCGDTASRPLRAGPGPEDSARFMAEFREQTKLMELVFARYHGMGIAFIDSQPAGATLYIDGGQVDTEGKSLTLPSRTYEFKAVWPDGTASTRRVFIKPALQDWNLKFNYESNSNGFGGNRNSNVDFNVPLQTTKVELRPGAAVPAVPIDG